MKVPTRTFVFAEQIGKTPGRNIISHRLAEVTAGKIQTIFGVIIKQSA
jgi:hypothetical protein